MKLLVATHRGPVTYRRVRGKLVGTRGSGGLIGAIAPVLERFGGTWIASSLSPDDAGEREADGFSLRFLDLPPDEHRDHYDRVSNEVLWFVFHYLFDLAHAPVFDAAFDRAWANYRLVNERYARAIASSPQPDAVFIEDYHLMTAAEDLRRVRRRWDVPLLYFHHVPWAEPDYFSLLPTRVVDDILRGLLSFDVVGFHATRWARAFLSCCDRLVRGASVSDDRVTWRGRTTRVLVAPVPLDVERVRGQMTAPTVERWMATIREQAAGRRILLRVDRVELSKNVLRGFLAYQALLERRPELARDSMFLALVYPSRPRVAEYRRYLGACLAAAHRITERFPGALDLRVHDDYHRSLAGMRLADALLVNPVYDGLNLVAKEGAVVGDPALVLSRNAGAAEVLSEAAVLVNPFDVTETAHAIERALSFTPAERGRRASKLRRLASAGTPEGWVRGRLDAAGLRF